MKEKCYLYRNENKIAYKSNEIIEKYYKGVSEREKFKKKEELFHLLVLIDLANNDKKEKINEVIPNEPGDAIIIDKDNNKHLFEIFKVFGDEENILMRKLIENIFKGGSREEKYCYFDAEKMKGILLKKLSDKNDKDYLLDSEYTTKNILIVTCEHNRCAIAGEWVGILLGKVLQQQFTMKNYDNLFLLDYMASGKDGGPISYNLEEEVSKLKEYGLI